MHRHSLDTNANTFIPMNDMLSRLHPCHHMLLMILTMVDYHHHHLDTMDSTLRQTHMVLHLLLRNGRRLQRLVIFGTIA